MTMTQDPSTNLSRVPQGAKQIVIIGSGVIGLTAAYELSSHYASSASITIIARDMPHDGLDSTGWASPWAGANWYPFQNKDPELGWEKVSWKRFRDKSKVPEEFIMSLPTRLYLAETYKLEDIWYREEVGDLVALPEPWPASIGSAPYTGSAFGFTTLSICVPTYLRWLEDELTKRDVKFVKGWVGSVADLEYVPGSNSQVRTDVVVNASGLGAKNIIGIEDDLVFPVRGQTVLVRAPQVKWCLMGLSFYVNKETDETIYFIPRINGDIVIGGTFQEGNWDVSPDADIARGILERALRYCPELVAPNPTGDPPKISDITILRHNVGLRPARKSGARVEKEIITFKSKSQTRSKWEDMAPVPDGIIAGQSAGKQERELTGEELRMRVVHAYGMGPAGYQASWGVAEDVVKLVGEFFSEIARPSKP
ncbi:hypothetical protein FRB94_005337 [Tulasnella sp. JGI-2019a]|nr:hypothetical protein FRB93_002777 [Tulasnella sp. JGI-2019a]KAG9000591.1 hypothetical protein FRB94_005337 [Tulasnella sp. JGI-2019a]KAG9027457.1 hypothetical protein FRB95_007757 [Tulasnella sp. JGI-2019a]